MDGATIRVRLPVLAKLILGEMAESRGKTDEALLVELIKAEAAREMRHARRAAGSRAGVPCSE